MEVLSTDHKQVNNLTSLSFCFLSNEYSFSFVFVKTNMIFDLFLFTKFTFLFYQISDTLYIFWYLAKV